jgi:hypothetical protein
MRYTYFYKLVHWNVSMSLNAVVDVEATFREELRKFSYWYRMSNRNEGVIIER